MKRFLTAATTAGLIAAASISGYHAGANAGATPTPTPTSKSVIVGSGGPLVLPKAPGYCGSVKVPDQTGTCVGTGFTPVATYEKDTLDCGHYAKPALDWSPKKGWWAYCEPALVYKGMK